MTTLTKDIVFETYFEQKHELTTAPTNYAAHFGIVNMGGLPYI